ncbi:GNAT family N-acetyltransferase [Akkermansiaceae bacterium]|nr:GNAT family N-acetyltransferase [bacterium]MDA7670096.1 GNAT family N-acetyltransferase [Akkermansiaceae bacterium]MDA7895408.1 GNAT family N-acetyltransferase [Akkermansiaceae bacterium]MDA8976145.1 GNAT family N-acetyltransferase [bacterium]MDB4377226.1 GNAT family N-acetyltransferase [Akkermansiaceae bacterium]
MSTQGVRGIKVWYLEITEEEEFIPSEVVTNLSLEPTDDAAINTQFYREVGGDWQWVDRLNWTDNQWEKWVSRENLRTWIAHLGAEAAGYVEMEIQEGGNIEIVYFGLLPLMIGKGIGGGVLSLAIREAWKIKGTQRVWLHTCSEDHPHALGNYEKRGFRLFKTEVI